MSIPLTACPICGSASKRVGMKSGFTIARCGRCHHGFVEDQPSIEELRVFYEYERGMSYVPDFVFGILADVVERFRSFRLTGRLLDVGFGAGAMLRVASDAGWEPHGIEISHSAVTAAKAAGVRGVLVEGDFLAYPYEPASFDVVVFDGIVSNLLEPKAFFSRAHEVLRPGGLLYVTTAHGRGLSARILGTSWSACAPPEIIHYFSARSVALAAGSGGFKRTSTYTRGVNPYELLRIFRSAARVPRGTAVNEAVLRTSYGRAVKRVANLILRATGLGDQLYLEAIA